MRGAGVVASRLGSCSRMPQTKRETLYHPRVRYTYADGMVDTFPHDPSAMAWYTFPRALSSVFGSIARRLRGTWFGTERRTDVVRATGEVVTSDGRVVWSRRFEFVEGEQ